MFRGELTKKYLWQEYIMNKDFVLIKNDVITDEEIRALRKSVGWDNNCYPFSKCKKNFYVYFTLRHKKNLIGFIGVISDGFNDAYIQDLMIAREYQLQGFGTQLMNKTINYLKSKNIKCIQVTFNPELIEFYKRFGFHIFNAGIIDKDDKNSNTH